MAGPLFTTAERNHNEEMADLLSRALPGVEIVLPQNRAAQFMPDLRAVTEDCLRQIREADLVVACLDGPDADSGTCVEVGYAMALGVKVIGYRSDFRGSEVGGVNAMLYYGVSDFVQTSSFKDSLRTLAFYVAVVAHRLLFEMAQEQKCKSA